MEEFPLIQRLVVLITLSCILGANVRSQSPPDPQLLAEINKIKAVDNHSHPLRYVGEGEKADDEYDALPLESIEPFPLPVRLAPDNPEFVGAWKHFYGYKYNDLLSTHVDELLSVKKKVYQQEGDHFPSWVLDQLNIETMFANRVALGRGLTSPRFRW